MKRLTLFLTLSIAVISAAAQNFKRSTLTEQTLAYQWYMAEFNSNAPKAIGEGVPLFVPEGVSAVEVRKWAVVSYFGDAVKGSVAPTVIIDARYDSEGRLVSTEVRGSGERMVVKYNDEGAIMRCGLYNVADGSTIKDMTSFFDRFKTIGDAMQGHDKEDETYYFDYSGRGDRCKFVGTGPKKDDYNIDFLQTRQTPTTLNFSLKCLVISKGRLAMRYGVLGWRKIMKMRGVEKAQKCFTYYCESPENCDMVSPNSARNKTLNEAGFPSSRSAESIFADGWQNEEYIMEYVLTE